MSVIEERLNKKDVPIDEWTSAWDRDVQTRSQNRSEAFQDVTRHAEQMLEAVRSSRFPNGDVEYLDQRRENWYRELYESFCLDSALRLSRAIHRRPNGSKRFVLAFDGCSFLDRAQSSGMTLTALQRIIKAQDLFQSQLDGFIFWFLFLDTNPRIMDFFPKRNKESTGHLATLRPLPPWLYFDFDLLVPDVNPRTPYDALALQHLRRYGRPVRF
jgi:hypothetical protein